MQAALQHAALFMSGEFERVPQMTEVKLKQTEVNTEKNETAVTLAEYCYLAYFAVMLFARGIGLYEGTTAYTVTLVIGLGLFALKILMTEHTVFEYLWMGLFLLLSLVVYHNTGEKGLLVYMTMMLGIKGVSMKRVFRTGITVWTAAFLIIHVLTLAGAVSETTLMHYKNGIGYILCHGLGYPHPNVLHIAYLVIAVFAVYQAGRLDRKKLIAETVFLFIGNLYVFMWSVSYTGFLATTVFLIFNFYFQSRRKITKPEQILIQCIFPICVLFSVLGPVAIKGHLFDLINKALNTRYFLSNYFLTQQPITLFGTRFIVPNYRYTMDCSYVYAFMQLGVVTFLIICILYMLLIRNCLIRNRRIEAAIILGTCVAGVTEPFMFNLAYKNMIFLFLGVYLFECSQEKESVAAPVLSKKLRILSIGQEKVSDRLLFMDQVCATGKRLLTECRKHLPVMIAAFVIGCAVPAAVCMVYTAVPSRLYVAEKSVNISDRDQPLHLSQADIQQIRQSGDLIEGYSGEKQAMYAFTGNTAAIEYFRRIICVSAWIGILLCMTVAVYFGRMRRRKPE